MQLIRRGLGVLNFHPGRFTALMLQFGSVENMLKSISPDEHGDTTISSSE